MICERCGKWAGAHATLPGQSRDHLCLCHVKGAQNVRPPDERTVPLQVVADPQGRIIGVLDGIEFITADQAKAIIAERDAARAEIDRLREVLKQARALLDEATSYTSSAAWSPSMTRDCCAAIAAIDAELKEAS